MGKPTLTQNTQSVKVSHFKSFMKRLLSGISLLTAMAASSECKATPSKQPAPYNATREDPCYNPNLMSSSTRNSWAYRADLCHELTTSIRPRLEMVLLAEGLTPTDEQRRLIRLRIADRIAHTLYAVASSVSFGYSGAPITDLDNVVFNPLTNLHLIARYRLGRSLTQAQAAIISDFNFLRNQTANLADILPPPNTIIGNPGRALDMVTMDLVAGMHTIPQQVMKGSSPASPTKHWR